MQLPEVARQFAYLIPMWIVHLTGIVLAVIYFRQHTKAALFALAGFAGLLLSSAGFMFYRASLMEVESRGDMTAGELVSLIQMLNVLQGLVQAGCMALVMTAIFIGRRDPGLPEANY